MNGLINYNLKSQCENNFSENNHQPLPSSPRHLEKPIKRYFSHYHSSYFPSFPPQPPPLPPTPPPFPPIEIYSKENLPNEKDSMENISSSSFHFQTVDMINKSASHLSSIYSYPYFVEEDFEIEENCESFQKKSENNLIKQNCSNSRLEKNLHQKTQPLFKFKSFNNNQQIQKNSINLFRRNCPSNKNNLPQKLEIPTKSFYIHKKNPYVFVNPENDKKYMKEKVEINDIFENYRPQMWKNNPWDKNDSTKIVEKNEILLKKSSLLDEPSTKSTKLLLSLKNKSSQKSFLNEPEPKPQKSLQKSPQKSSTSKSKPTKQSLIFLSRSKTKSKSNSAFSNIKLQSKTLSEKSRKSSQVPPKSHLKSKGLQVSTPYTPPYTSVTLAKLMLNKNDKGLFLPFSWLDSQNAYDITLKIIKNENSKIPCPKKPLSSFYKNRETNFICQIDKNIKHEKSGPLILLKKNKQFT